MKQRKSQISMPVKQALTNQEYKNLILKTY